MSGEVEPLTRESTLEGQVAEKTVGQAGGIRNTERPGHPQLHQEMPRKEKKGQLCQGRQGRAWEGAWGNHERPLALTTFNTAPFTK